MDPVPTSRSAFNPNQRMVRFTELIYRKPMKKGIQVSEHYNSRKAAN